MAGEADDADIGELALFFGKRRLHCRNVLTIAIDANKKVNLPFARSVAPQ
jgi:hypothetical protein